MASYRNTPARLLGHTRATDTAGTSWRMPTRTSTRPKCELRQQAAPALSGYAQWPGPWVCSASLWPGCPQDRCPTASAAAQPKQNLPSVCCRRRVFLLGPSHHFYSKSCLLSAAASYDTPLGALPGA